MATLNEHMGRSLTERLFAHTCRLFPEQFAVGDEPQVRNLVAHAMQRGPSYGIESEQGLALLVGLLVILGEDFDQRPDSAWARRILELDELDPAERLDLVYAEL